MPHKLEMKCQGAIVSLTQMEISRIVNIYAIAPCYHKVEIYVTLALVL